MNKREWLVSKIGSEIVDQLPNAGVAFYYMAMHDNGMDLSDADRYAWLNMLFGDDIGVDAARKIIDWYHGKDLDVMELTHTSKKEVMGVCEELGLHLFFEDWPLEEPDYIDYTCMVLPMIKKQIDKMFDNGYTIDQVCGCICGLFYYGLINDVDEMRLHEYADPDNVMEIAAFEAWCEFEGENPLDYMKEEL